ncbi:hypothetical protein E2C01_068405 [Portunus trituberculatus]|uniref:Uncharacterized protein n=1 Tax=Portunus trituberculatus TaxID=210409 RepID=A0A5B7HNR1_PORTR|nr:hypothetical protein [Portunus trituberculatus]
MRKKKIKKCGSNRYGKATF